MMGNQIEATPLRMEKRQAVEARTGLSTSLLYAEMARGRFPRPYRVGPKAVAWKAAEVDEWINSRVRAAA